MAVVTNALLNALRTGFRAEFQRALQETPSSYASVATLVPSSSASNTYGWLGQFPQLQEWIGSRVLRDIKEHAYAIVNKRFESTVEVPRTAIEDDEIGVYKPLFSEMGRAAKTFPDKLVFDLIKAGTATACFDGQNFFDDEHPVYANVDGTGAATSVSNFTDGTKPAWYLLDASRALKPVIFQERTKPELDVITTTDNDAVFMRDQYPYGIRYRCNVGFGFWQLAYCSKADLTETTFDAAYDAMAAFKADGGRPLGVKPTLLVVPTTLRTAAQNIIKAKTKANGATNTNADIVELLVTPWLN